MLSRICPPLLFLFGLTISVLAGPLVNVPARDGATLNGQWRVIVDPYENGYYSYRWTPFDEMEHPYGGYFLDQRERGKSDLIEYDFDTSETLRVPGDWNSQRAELLYYEGTVWYRKLFSHAKVAPDHRVFIHFGGANYETHVYLNGKKLGTHIGGFTPFWFEVTDTLQAGENSLVVKVDNKRHADAVPTLNTDWWNYGGLTREVRIVEVPATFVADYQVQFEAGGPCRLKVRVALEGAQREQAVHVRIRALKVDQTLRTDASGVGEAEIALPPCELWSPESPKLYDVTIAAETDTVRERLGFRTIETRGTEILLNGEPVFLRGISLHEENPLRGGRAWSREDAELLLGWAKELGCNFVRLAHYPHNDHMARVAEEMGIMLWAEIPVYWTIAWENPDTLANARNQLRELIERDRNRASVIVWSVANETPVSEPRTRFLRTLIDDARALDGTRLVSAAMERHGGDDPNVFVVGDPLGAYVDLISFNEYVGWYDGLPEKCDRVSFETPYDKPMVVSEMGGGALQGLHGDALTRFSEEFQADLYTRNLAMLERVPQWRDVTPWILVDFRSPRRPLPGIQDGWNRKGLIGSNGVRKAAFRVLQAFYQGKQIEEGIAAAAELDAAMREE